MLELRANCECCGKVLPPNATDAMICSFECTFCQDCVQQVLHNVCPNCGGGFERRPIRPQAELKTDPAKSTPQPISYGREKHQAFLVLHQNTAPEDR